MTFPNWNIDVSGEVQWGDSVQFTVLTEGRREWGYCPLISLFRQTVIFIRRTTTACVSFESLNRN
jgi:hypothetical protein